MNKKLAIYVLINLSLWACGGSEPSSGDITPTPISLTTLKITFALTGEANQVVEIQDNDGASGPNVPSIIGQPLTLKKNKTYNITTQILNNNQDVTSQITNQGTTHQLRYTNPNLGNNLTFSSVDVDSNGKPIGILVTAITNINVVSGSLTVALFREVNKNNPSSGTKVIEGTFNVNIID